MFVQNMRLLTHFGILSFVFCTSFGTLVNEGMFKGLISTLHALLEDNMSAEQVDELGYKVSL